MEEKQEIPEVNIEGGKVVLPTLEVPIIFNKKEDVVVMKKITSGENMNNLKNHISTSIVGQQMQGKVIEPLQLMFSTLTKVIIKAPFGYTDKELKDLPEGVPEYLYSQYQDWCKKKLKSGEN